MKIAKLWLQSDGKKGLSKIRWQVETTFNDNTTARDEWLRRYKNEQYLVYYRMR